jgi:hypothetical protein
MVDTPNLRPGFPIEIVASVEKASNFDLVPLKQTVSGEFAYKSPVTVYVVRQTTRVGVRFANLIQPFSLLSCFVGRIAVRSSHTSDGAGRPHRSESSEDRFSQYTTTVLLIFSLHEVGIDTPLFMFSNFYLYN